MDWLSYIAVSLIGAGFIGVFYFTGLYLIRSGARDDDQFEAALEGDLSNYVQSLKREAAE